MQSITKCHRFKTHDDYLRYRLAALRDEFKQKGMNGELLASNRKRRRWIFAVIEWRITHNSGFDSGWTTLSDAVDYAEFYLNCCVPFPS